MERRLRQSQPASIAMEFRLRKESGAGIPLRSQPSWLLLRSSPRR